jgi:hypothetical protein
MDYHQINRISNSDLSQFKSEVILGKEYRRPQKAFDFGNAFHAMLLEPHLPIKSYSSVDYCLVNKLVEKVRKESCCNWHLMNGCKEQIILFEDATTLAKCKAKLDVVTSNLDGVKTIIMDFKTTQEKDYAAFLNSMLAYDYDRQAAFYTDSIGAETFIFVGVQKIMPYELFFFEATKAPGFLEYGRKKYKALLKKYVAYHNLAANNFYKHVA